MKRSYVKRKGKGRPLCEGCHKKQVRFKGKYVDGKTKYGKLCFDCHTIKYYGSTRDYEQMKFLKKMGIKWDGAGWKKRKIKLQDGKCAICEVDLKGEMACIDHDHKTQKFRGLLCSDCNKGLGFFKDSIISLEAAISYLRVNGKK